jgi:hypothetical protein
VLFLQLLADNSEVIHPTVLQLQRNDIFKNMDINYKYTLLVGVTRLLGNFVDAVRLLLSGWNIAMLLNLL